MAGFGNIMPVLRVTDCARSVDWYTRVLGFEVVWSNPAGDDGATSMLRSDNTRLLLSTGTHLGAAPAFTGALYFETDNVAELFARVKDEATVVWPTQEMEYGTLEFGIRDPDGYTLAFAKDLESDQPESEG